MLTSLGIGLGLAQPAAAAGTDMQIIAHRGASAERPEHTLAAYERAIDQGADFIEPDLVVTRDLVLISRHENELSDTTDVASREEFESRRREKTIDGQRVAGWFAEDFTLAEIRMLRVLERIPSIRPANARYNGLYQVATFDEIVQLVRVKEAETGRRIGLYPELKHPGFLLQEAGIDTVDLLAGALRRHGLDGAGSRVIVQSFEIAPLQRLRRMLDVRLAQLIAHEGGPADEPGMRYAEMIAPSGLKAIARYADAIGVDVRLVLGAEGTPTTLVADAKAAGLEVHAWTVRPENAFLPAALKSPGGDAVHGNAAQLLEMLRKAGVDAVFTDAPALANELRPPAP